MYFNIYHDLTVEQYERPGTSPKRNYEGEFAANPGNYSQNHPVKLCGLYSVFPTLILNQ